MQTHTRLHPLIAGAMLLALGAVALPSVASAHNISETATVGRYTITLKVLPAESFTGFNAQMIPDSGAAPYLLNGDDGPNHHLVAFVTRNGKTVEHARVAISFINDPAAGGQWTKLPVVRMHVAGRGLATTHYGNNVALSPGVYGVRVSVNGSAPASFRFTVGR
ncbi:MAG TPA: hypothetical protein VJ992_16110 [Gemmatimonadales bacterium]|nr:hypothetical protein [Gemmatimonadales bacterium]